MSAIPEQLREEIVSSKAMTTLGILAKAMQLYQPGGLSEKSAILAALESPGEAPNVHTAITTLQEVGKVEEKGGGGGGEHTWRHNIGERTSKDDEKAHSGKS